MRFLILGSVEVWAGDLRLGLGGPRQLGLVAFLLLHRNRAVSRDVLMDTLWGTDAGSGDKRLQMAVARVRRELEPAAGGGERRLRTVGGGYLLAVEPGELDADVFADRVKHGRAALSTGDPEAASALLDEALALWRGPPLAELSFADFAQAEIRQLEELRLAAIESRFDAELALGRHAGVVAELEGVVVEEPTRERIAGQLMLALYRCGRQSDALGVYQRVRGALLEQLGLEPGPELRALQNDILEQASALDLDGGGVTRHPAFATTPPDGTITGLARQTPSLHLTNLLAPRAELVGRDRELDEIVDAILSEPEQLVTLTGRGGAGKTSLALLAGTTLLDRHPGGVWWVDLTNVETPDEVPIAIAGVIGAEGDPEGSVAAAITTRLRNTGATLVILDNMEHVLAAARPLCALLNQLPDVRVLATSRLPLRVEPERMIPLGALDERSALELIARAVRRRGLSPGVAQTDPEALREIVKLLDGLPLALELAATRLSILSAAQLRDRLRRSIDVLGETRRDRPARQRSLRAALDSTLELLEPSSRALFIRMGAFAGAVALEELERVLSDDDVDVLDALAELVDAALAQRVETGDGTVTFGLPEALRQIAAEMLDREPDGERWRRAHATHQYELVWPFRLVLVDRSTYLAARAAEREAGAALRWASATGDPLEHPIAVAYALLLLEAGRVREAGAVIGRLISAPPSDPEVCFLVLCTRSHYLGITGRNDEARRLADEAYRVAPDAHSRCHALLLRGLANVFAGRAEEAVRDHAEATALARELADPAFLAGALGFEAQALTDAGLLDKAAARLHEARAVGSSADANILHRLDTNVGDLALSAGRPAEALEPYARSLQHALADHAIEQVVNDLFGVAEALAALGHDAEALQVAGMAESQCAEIGAAPEKVHVEHLLASEQRLGPARSGELKRHDQSGGLAERVARACQLARAYAPVQPPSEGQ